jgi:predicted DNA-binding transcriptional regulator AlpA
MEKNAQDHGRTLKNPSPDSRPIFKNPFCLHDQEAPPTSVVVRDYNVPALLEVSSTTAWRYSHSKDYPQKIQLGPNATGRLRSELMAWITRRKVKR